jgi:hypothetical protein
MNESVPELLTDKKPEAAPAKPGLVQVLLAVAAALCFLFHGVADLAEWVILNNDTEDVPAMAADVDSMSEATSEATETDAYDEEYEMPVPVWVGAFLTFSLPLGLLLAIAAEWNFQKIPWKAGVIFCVFAEAALGLIAFLYFYGVGGLNSEGLIFALVYMAWNANRFLLLAVWNFPRKWGWLLPAAALALAFAGLAFIDTLTFLFPEPGIYGFRFLEGTFVQSVATSLSNLDDLNMYVWLGAKGFLTLSLLLLTVPVVFKQLPTRTPKPNAPPL